MMKPQIISIILVISLLAASAVCVGTRYASDRQQAEARAASRMEGSTMNVVDSNPVSPRGGMSRREMVPQALASRLRSVLATASSAERDRALLAMTDEFRPDDWPLALAALREMGMSDGAEQSLLLSVWAEKDIASALEWAEKEPSAVLIVVRAWLGKDPDAALSYVLSPDRKKTMEGQLLTARMLESLVMDAPRLSMMLASLSDRERRFAMEQASPGFPAEDAEAVGKWLDAFDPALRGEMLALRLRGLSRFEDKSTLAHAFSEDLGPNHYGTLYKEWVKVDKEAANAALKAMDPGDIQKAAYHGVVIGLLYTNRMDEVVEAYRAYPEYQNQYLLGDLLLNFNVKDADLLLSLVPEIKNPDLKLSRYRELLYQWLQADAPGAKKWMEENEVPEQVRRQLAKP